MNFIIQKESHEGFDGPSIEREIVLDKLRHTKYTNDYTEMSLEEVRDLEAGQINDLMQRSIPIGTIEFVTAYLNKTHGFERQNPIEVPKYLRTPAILKREYNILSSDCVPETGRYFIKNASKLKDFSYCGELQGVVFNKIQNTQRGKNEFSLGLSASDLYVVSEAVDIEAEFRVYVFQKNIEAVTQYDGDPLISPDASFIQNLVDSINTHEKWLRSYTLDIMVTSAGTSLIEVHNFTSCGLYSTLWGDNLLYAYRDGIDYLLNDNRKIEV